VVPPESVDFNVNAFCPAGQAVLGGGFFASIGIVARSGPITGGWNAFIDNYTPVSITVNAYVVCGAR
jgi:hypothetical protein